jgi:general secretion pathway protein A
MYERFFNVERAPFAMVPDPDCIFMTGQHADVISGAVYGILERKGCILLTGEAGLGKTTALKASMELLKESNAHCSLLIHTTLDASEFLELALLNFGISPLPPSKAQRLLLLESFLKKSAAEGRVCVLIVDEAHKLHSDALEEIRLLGNLEANGHKLLQILLAGQNELVDRLNQQDLWQLKQRIAFRLSLQRLDREAVEQYVRFRWKKAGGKDLPFEDVALDGVARWSLGIPRVVNAICDNSLLVAFSDTRHRVGLSEVESACQDLDLATPPLHQRRTETPSPASGVQKPSFSTVATSVAQPAPKQTMSSKPATPPPTMPPVPARQQTESKGGWARSGNDHNGSWGAQRPSLLKRWFGFADDDREEDELSLKRHL